MSSVIAIYHKDCNDGTAAAAVMLRKFPKIKLFPLKHSYSQMELSTVLKDIEKEDEVYTVDCGLGAEDFLLRGCSVTTIDHHVGSKKFFEKLEKKYPSYKFIFNNNKSGASLCWAYLFPNEEEPKLIKYIEDVDLWILKYGNDSKDVSNYISMFRNDPWSILEILESDLQEVKKKGAIISMYADKEIENIVQTSGITIKIGKYEVPAFNITSYESATGNILSAKHNSAVALFKIIGEQTKVSFRSHDRHNPTSLLLAQILGGGGHRNAAAAQILLKDFLKLIKVK